MTRSDYHDYVIKDGRFIGEFELMYRDCEDPWRQDQLRHPAEELVLAAVRNHPPRRVLDIGCGRGAFTGRMWKELGAGISAIDIAPTAIRIAASRFPGVRFSVMDARDLHFAPDSFDLTIASELLWYVLPRLSDVFAEIRRVTTTEGRIIFIQHFYQTGEQRYGTDVMQTVSDLLGFLPFAVEQMVEFDRLRNHKVVLFCKNAK